MRFIIAIGVFVVAAVLLGTGVIQKVFLSGPEMITMVAEVKPSEPYLVIDGKTLTLHGTNPFITVTGGSQGNFVGYGRTENVEAWIGTDQFQTANYSDKKSEFVLATGKHQITAGKVTNLVELPEQTILTPEGSDLWLGEAAAEKIATVPTADMTEGMSAIIASDGVANAPGKVTIAWPQPSSVPFATGFIIIGGILALVGLLLYLWALRHDKYSQGPRRRGRGPRPPAPRAITMPKPKSLVSAMPKGRRSLGRGSALIAVGLAGSLTLGLSGCSPFQAPKVIETSTPTATANPEIEGAPPAVTERQLAVILSKISVTLDNADSSLDENLSSTRLVGPAQEIRAANYAIRRADGGVAALPALAASPITFILPQATDTWPRQVIAVVQDEKDPTVPTTGIMMIQNSPRENYHIEYMVTLEPNASVPTVAPATVGASLVMPNSKLLLIAPDQLSEAYGSVLMQGEASPYYGLFDLTADSLVPQVGKAYKDQKIESVSGKATVEFSQSPGTGIPMGLATLDSGAIVTVGLNEVDQLLSVCLAKIEIHF